MKLSVFLILVFLFMLFHILYETNRLKHLWNASNNKAEEYSRKWHIYNWFMYAALLCLGIYIGKVSNTYLSIFCKSFFVGSIYWILHDGFINIQAKRKFFYDNKSNVSLFHYFDNWYIKILVLIISIILFVIFY